MSAVTASLGEAGEPRVQSVSVLGLGWRSEMCRYPPHLAGSPAQDNQHHSESYQTYSMSTFYTFKRLPSPPALKSQARTRFPLWAMISDWLRCLLFEGLVRSVEKGWVDHYPLINKTNQTKNSRSRIFLKYNFSSSTKTLLSETNSWNLDEEPSYFPTALGPRSLSWPEEGVKDIHFVLIELGCS